MNIFAKEPALVIGAAVAVVGLCAALFGIDDGTQKAILAVVNAVVPLLGALLVRSQVSPVAKSDTTGD